MECLFREDFFWAMVYILECHVHEIFTRPLLQHQQSLNIRLCLENSASVVSQAGSSVLSCIQHVSIKSTSTYYAFQL